MNVEVALKVLYMLGEAISEKVSIKALECVIWYVLVCYTWFN